MKYFLYFLAAASMTAGCTQPDRTVYPADDNLLNQRELFAGLTEEHVVQIAGEDEPGRRLIVLGTLIESETSEKIPNHPVQFYHADSSGSYGVRGEYAARLNGTVLTDSLGRFVVETILPAGYGNGPKFLGSGHIHLLVEGAYPEAYDFYFMQGIGSALLRWANRTDQAVVLELKSIDGDTLLAQAELVVRGL